MEGGAETEEAGLVETSVSVTGHTVVLTAIDSVVTWPWGQFVTVGAQDVTV